MVAAVFLSGLIIVILIGTGMALFDLFEEDLYLNRREKKRHKRRRIENERLHQQLAEKQEENDRLRAQLTAQQFNLPWWQEQEKDGTQE